jgi:TatD DNase family protein
MLVDSHCHLDFEAFDPDRADVVARAVDAGVSTFLTIGTHLSRHDRVRRLADDPRIYCSVGIHPHQAGEEGVTTPDRLIELAADPRVVGLGETGLDYYYDRSPRDAQQANFRTHIAAARETGLPIIVHTRDADDDAIRILTEEHARGPFGGVLHCFSSSQELADAALKLGFFISFSGIVTFKNAEAVRAVAKTVPADRILVETDAPFLAPVPLRGKRNEPAFMVHTAARLAEERGENKEAFSINSSENFFRLFNKIPKPGG